MIKKIAIVSSCILLAFIMAVNSFAISRFDAYSYWASAQNNIGFIGNDISNIFNYSKSTGMNPPVSIQSDFYKNGYYSNNVALFTQHSAGTASFDITGYSNVFSWTFNGTDGTTPLDEGFVTGNGGSVSLTDSGARLGPYNGTASKYLTYNSEDQIAVYDFRMSTSGISDSSNYSRVAIVFEYEGVSYSVAMSLSSALIGWTGATHPLQSGFGVNRGAPHFDVSQYQDFRIVVENTTATLFINGSRYTSVTGQHFNDLPASGMYFVSNKYEYTNIYSVSAKILDKPSSTVIVNLGRSVLIPSGDDMEFYIHMRNGSVTNVTTETTVDLDYTSVSNMSIIFHETVAIVPIVFSDDWLYVRVPSSDSDRTFSSCYFTFSTPYVNTTIGDQLRWDMVMSFSDLVFGDPDDIGFNPDIDPEQDKFRNEVLGGINDVKQEIHDGFDIINGTLEDVRQDIQNGFDMVEDALSRDDTFEVETIQPDYDSITAPPDQDVGVIVGPSESEALEDFDAIMLRAESIIADADFVTARYWWQDVFSEIFSWSVLGLLGVLSSFFLIIRALLGR